MKDEVSPSLRTNPIWKDIYDIVKRIYERLDELVTQFPDEKWTIAAKLRTAASGSLFYASQAIGNANIDASEYDWNYVRKNLFSMQAMYMLAGKQSFLQVDPAIVIKIDKLLQEADRQIVQAKAEAVAREKQDMEPWLKKYRLWKKMNDA